MARLQAELPKVREDATVKQKAAAVGMTMAFTPAEALRARIEAEVPRWRQLIPDIGLKIDQ